MDVSSQVAAVSVVASWRTVECWLCDERCSVIGPPSKASARWTVSYYQGCSSAEQTDPLFKRGYNAIQTHDLSTDLETIPLSTHFSMCLERRKKCSLCSLGYCIFKKRRWPTSRKQVQSVPSTLLWVFLHLRVTQ